MRSASALARAICPDGIVNRRDPIQKRRYRRLEKDVDRCQCFPCTKAAQAAPYWESASPCHPEEKPGLSSSAPPRDQFDPRRSKQRSVALVAAMWRAFGSARFFLNKPVDRRPGARERPRDAKDQDLRNTGGSLRIAWGQGWGCMTDKPLPQRPAAMRGQNEFTRRR